MNGQRVTRNDFTFHIEKQLYGNYNLNKLVDNIWQTLWQTSDLFSSWGIIKVLVILKIREKINM